MDKSFKKNNVIFIVFCVLFSLHAGSDEEQFLRGNEYYKKEEYDRALASYKEVASQGRAVLYNMGNCFYHKNEYDQALIYWNRAERNASYGERTAIEHNKEHLRSKNGKVRTLSFIQKIYTIIAPCAHYVPVIMLQLFFVIIWYICIFFAYKRRKVLFSTMVICVMFFGTMLHIHYTEQTSIVGISTQKQSSIYAGPDDYFSVLSTIPQAESVVVIDQREGWYKVQHDDTIGWIKADAIQVV